MKFNKAFLKSIFIGAGGLFCILFIIFVLILPNTSKFTAQDKKLKLKAKKIKEQALYEPIYKNLKTKILEIDTPENLPAPKMNGLPKDKTGKIYSIFEKMTKSSKFVLEGVLSDVVTVGKNSYLMINVIMHGNFLNLRNFLLLLESEPYDKHIEEIKIKSMPGSMQVKLKIWMLQK
jgi:hypothetical protein